MCHHREGEGGCISSWSFEVGQRVYCQTCYTEYTSSSIVKIEQQNLTLKLIIRNQKLKTLKLNGEGMTPYSRNPNFWV